MSRFLNLFVVVSLMLVVAGSANAAVIFSDNWNDGTVLGPAVAAPGVDWTVESGRHSATAFGNWYQGTAEGWAFFGAETGKLMFDTEQSSRISVNFGASNGPVEAHFKLGQANGASGASYMFKFGFKNTALGKTYEERATLNPGYFGASGFTKWVNYGSYQNEDDGNWNVWAGEPGKALQNGTPGAAGWDYLKLMFDPATGVQVWQAIDNDGTKSYDDPSLTWGKVAEWANWKGLASVDQFYLENGTVVSWKVDDVEIVPEPSSILALAAGMAGMIGAVRRKH